MPLAQQLASELEAEVYLVRAVVWIDAFSGLRFDPDILRIIEDAKVYLAELQSRFGLPADRTVPIVPYGDNTCKGIITIAEEEDIDLIIMASRCKDRFQRLAQGSVCWEVLRSRVCPVCVCPCPAPGLAVDVAPWRRKERPMQILIAVDGSAECEVSLRVATRWVGMVNADIYLLQVVGGSANPGEDVNREPESALDIGAELGAMMKKARTYLNELVPRYGLPADRTRCLVCRSGNAAEGIVSAAQRYGIDLIVMSSHCRSWLGQLTQGSVYSEVVRSRVCPVLCAPLPRAQVRGQRWGVLARGR